MNMEFYKRLISSLIIIPFSFFFIIKGSYLFNLFLIACLFATFFEWYNMAKKYQYHIFGHLFILFSFYTVFCLRNDFGDKSLILFLFVTSICILTDLGGYIFGKILKGPKISKISPNKTYAGVFGGYIFSIFIFFFLQYSELLFDVNLKWTPELFIYMFLISSISQIGDFVISYFKRLSNIKDTGKIIPGHGGILDRIDGMIFAFPCSYVMFKFQILAY